MRRGGRATPLPVTRAVQCALGLAGKVLAVVVLLASTHSAWLTATLHGEAATARGRVVAAESERSEEKTRKTPALSSAVYDELTEAQELSEAGDIVGALRILNALRDGRRTKLNSYEQANLYNFYAFVYYQQERYEQAIQAYTQVLAQPDLPLAMETNTLYSLAQLYFVVEDYAEAIDALKRWFALAENPQPDAYVLLAQAYYQTKNHRLALQNVERAISLARAKGKAPKENWYLLMRVLYYEKGDLNKVAWVLEQLVRGWPKKEYLTQLSGARGELRQERAQLVAMETAYTAGLLSTRQELLNMAYLYLGTDTPYKAAALLQVALEKQQIDRSAKHYALLGSALRAAQENQRAIPAMERAAELAEDGEPAAQLATIYLDVGDYADAARAARAALNKGGLRRPDNMRVTLGTALFNLDKLDEARKQFQLAAKDKRSRKMAEAWINYLDSELSRRASLQDGTG